MKCKVFRSKFCQSLIYIGSFSLGATLLSAFSIFQKRLLNIPITFDIQAFVVPVLFGGISGLGIAISIVRLRKANAELREGREYLQDFMDNASDLIQSIAPDGRILYTNQAWRKTLGYQENEVLNESIFNFIANEDQDHCKIQMQTVTQGETIRVQFALKTKYGEKIYVDGWVNCRFEEGRPVSTRGILRNVTATRLAEEAQRLTAKVFEHANDGIFVADKDGFIITVNKAFTNMTGFHPDEIAKARPFIFVSAEQNLSSQLEGLHHAIHAKNNWQGEIIATKKNGGLFPAMLKLSNVQDNDGNVTNYIGLLTDVTLRKQTEERLKHLATHDMSTNLPNRILFTDRLQEEIWLAEQNQSMVAVLYMDLDGFKAINDSCGHAAGDDYLRVLADRLKSCISEGNTVARLGGDEFAILLGGITSQDEATQIAENILITISQPVTACGQQLRTTASIGISIYPEHSNENALLSSADQAMYIAKNNGKNTYYVHTKEGFVQ